MARPVPSNQVRPIGLHRALTGRAELFQLYKVSILEWDRTQRGTTVNTDRRDAEGCQKATEDAMQWAIVTVWSRPSRIRLVGI